MYLFTYGCVCVYVKLLLKIYSQWITIEMFEGHRNKSTCISNISIFSPLLFQTGVLNEDSTFCLDKYNQ